MEINSTPQQAQFRIVTAGGGITGSVGVETANGVTPARVNVPQKTDYIVHMKLAGYEEAKVPITRSMNGWFVCSLLCGILPGGIDLLTGGMWDLEPEKIVVTLQPVASAPAAPPAGAPPGALPPPVKPVGPPTQVRADDAPGTRLYVLVFRKDEDGQLRYLAVPLVPETA